MKKLYKIISAVFLIGIITLTLGSNKSQARDYITYENFEYSENDDGTVSLHRLLNRTTITEIEIPEQIDGKKVKSLAARFATPNQGEETALKKITLPSTIEYMGNIEASAFENTPNLEEIIVDSKNENFVSIDGVVYSKDKTKICCYPANKPEKNYNILNTVTSIEPETFAFAKNLDNVNIPDSVTKIGSSAFAQSSIKSIKIPSSVTSDTSYLCYKCNNLVTAEINSSQIGFDNYFECKNLTTVTLGENTRLIRDDAFWGCTSLKSINFENVNTIEKYAFIYCSSLPKTINMSSKLEVLHKWAFDSDVKIVFDGSYSDTEYKWYRCANLKIDGNILYTEAYKVFDIVNTERKNANLSELKLDKNLTDIATQRAYEIAIYYEHKRPDTTDWDAGSLFDTIIYKMGLKDTININNGFAENIANGHSTSENVMKAWMNSEGHKANILGNFQNIGIGCVKTNRGYYWVQVFSGDKLTAETKRNDIKETRDVPTLSYYVKNYLSLVGPRNNTIEAGKTGVIYARIRIDGAYANGFPDASSFNWTSSNNKVLIVDQQGNITGKSKGTADVIATASDGTKKSISISVTGEDVKTPSVKYSTHVQKEGWQNFVKDGTTSGTTGKSLRLEGIKIKLDSTISGGIKYSTHVQKEGWQNFVENGALSGTTGKGYRLEAIKIELTGEIAKQYDIYYRVHAQKFGWMGWAKNGEQSGTQGYGYRLEGIQIKLVKKGETAPTSTTIAFSICPTLKYSSYVQKEGWKNEVSNGQTMGTTGKGLRMEALKINLKTYGITGGIKYTAHVQKQGWQNYVTSGKVAGTTGKNLRMEAIKIELTEEMAKTFDIYYRVHTEKFGWLGWAKNGEAAGTQGYGYRVEAMQIQLLPKGSKPSGSTANAFKQK